MNALVSHLNLEVTNLAVGKKDQLSEAYFPSDELNKIIYQILTWKGKNQTSKVLQVYIPTPKIFMFFRFVFSRKLDAGKIFVIYKSIMLEEEYTYMFKIFV